MFALYGYLLRLYPESFRARFGSELSTAVRDQSRLEGHVAWLRIFADVFASALVERIKEEGMRRKFAVLAFVTIAVLGGTFLATGATLSTRGGLVALSALGAIALVFGIATLVARRGGVGSEYVYAERRKRWWWIPAGFLGALEFAYGIRQLIQDPKIENVFALVVIGSFSALVFAGMALRNRKAGNWMIATGVLPMVSFIWIIFPPFVSLLVIIMAMSDNIRMARARPAV